MTDPAPRPPYICITKKFPEAHVKTWCDRDISASGETRYSLEIAIDKRDPITCPRCFSMIRSRASQPSLREYPGFSMWVMIYPFIGLLLFALSIPLVKIFPNEIYALLLAITSLLVTIYGTVKLLRSIGQADNHAQEKLDALLKKSPNRKTDD